MSEPAHERNLRHGSTVTLRDVAKAAGVSVSSASRALDDRPGRSNSAAAQHTRRVAEELGYRRNTIASNLRRQETGTLGVVVPRLSDTVMALMFEAIERTASRNGLFAVVATSGDSAKDEREAVETLLARNIDGVIVASTLRADDLPSDLRRRGVPHALVLRTDGVSPSSVGDDEVGGYLAVRHLLDLGHTDIGLLTGPLFASSAQGRLTGARRALDEAGLTVRPEWVVETGYGVADGTAGAERLLGSQSRPTAVFAANDNLAVGLYAVAQRQSIAIGEELAVVGYNDVPLASHLPVPLTSMRSAFDRIASTAVELILNPRESDDPIHRVLPTLIPRASSGGPLRTPDQRYHAITEQ